jgi:hypothetical protein
LWRKLNDDIEIKLLEVFGYWFTLNTLLYKYVLYIDVGNL